MGSVDFYVTYHIRAGRTVVKCAGADDLSHFHLRVPHPRKFRRRDQEVHSALPLNTATIDAMNTL